MYILRLAHTSRQDGHHQVRVALDGDNVSCAAISQFRFEIPAQDRENLRWYLEDYLKFPMEPAPMVAKRVERRISHLGQELFTRIFGGNDASSLWLQIAERLAETRIEVSSEVAAAAMLPWELLRDPHTKIPLALAAHTFVRVPSQPGSGAQPRLSQTDEARIRVLLVICRPAGSDDVPFRSVARRLVGLTASVSGVFQLDVLRPPTFARLVEVLREANSRGRPYHVVHFDGHGIWMDVSAGKSVPSDVENGSPCLAPSPARQGPRGFLLFENPDAWDNEQLVDGPALGRLLVETGVPVLVLNACRSAYADPPPAPEKVRAVGVHEGASAYGSLAQDVVDEGVAGVVAMRYNVYVVTATQFVGDLYAALLAGSSLGAAVTRGRKQLDAQPDREIGFHPRPLQDWMVPVVYEAAPLNLFHPWEADQLPSARLKPAGAREPDPGQLDPRLPSAPDAGFCGRDETILAMDLKFNHHQLVLARAYAGAGKTTTAAEFARWYALTGGVTGPVLFTSFGEHLVLSQVLDQLAERFPDQFETQGTSHSDTEPRDQRRQIALEILRQEPVLWIWDSVEPITGFPADSASDWTQAEQNELAEFLREVCETKAKVLLTSRRDESAWLGESVARVELLRMPMTERVELARAVAAKSGHRLTEVDDWRPLLAETQGNPLTLTVLVSQVLRDGLQSRQQIQAFVDRFRAGEIDLADDQRHDRANSLHASLTYGFERAFTSQEHDVLALLHLFRGTVDVRALCMMGNPEAVGDAAVQLAHGLSREDCIELLDRAAEVGVLHAADSAIGRLYADRSDISRRLGYYFIHPALPWYLRTLFTRAIGPRDSQAELATRRAYATAIADLGDHWNRRYNEGDVVLAYLLAEEEANLLHAWELARANGWGNQIIGTMQALHMLYQHTGRWETWARLVELATPNLVDLDTNHPLPGREGQWRLITTYRVVLAEQAHDWPTAERLQRLLVDWDRNQAATALTADPAALEPHRRNRIHTLAAALDTLGEQLREQRDPDCVSFFQEALALFERIDARRSAGIVAYHLSCAHSDADLRGLWNLDKAEQWAQYGQELTQPADQILRARCEMQLGFVYLERFREARQAGRSTEELEQHRSAATRHDYLALDLLPPNATRQLADAHNQLAALHADAYLNGLDAAMDHYREALRYDEAAGDQYGAATTRFNAALILEERKQRLEEAMEWAKAALYDLEPFGHGTNDVITKTQQLIKLIQTDMDREHLLTTAARLFVEHGYEGTSTEVILHESGLSSGMLPHHFANKQALFEAVLEGVLVKAGQETAVATQGMTDPIAALRAGCRAWVRLAGDPVVKQVVLIDAPVVIGWRRWREFDERHSLGQFKTAFQAAAEAGRVRPSLVEAFAHVLLAAINEIALLIAKADDNETAVRLGEDAVEELFDRLLGGSCL